MGLIFAVAGAAGLVLFALILWPPAALLVASLELLAAGLLVDWEALKREPAAPPRR